ncbi:hypothetical protein Tco_0545994 [Tanacetum coccineum]
MSNTNTNFQTQTSNALHNAIMEAGGKDRPPMLAPGNYNPPYKFKWNEKTVPIAEGSSKTTTEGYMENYKNVSQDIRDQLNAEAEAVQIILIGIDNDIYSTVDACPNACEIMAKNKVNEIRAKRLARNANPLALVAQQQPVYHPQNHPNHYTQNSSTKSQQVATRNRGEGFAKLIGFDFLYHSRKSTNLPTTTLELHQTPVEKIKIILHRLTEALAYHKEKMLLYKQEEAGFQLNAEQADWRDDTDDEPDDQELEAHYMSHPDNGGNSGMQHNDQS